MDQTTTPPQPQGAAPKPPVNDVQENKDIAALSYAWILSIFIYFWKKDSPFVTFHAKQGIVLFVLSILVWMIPVAGRFLELLVLAFCVFGFLAAAQGEWKDLPFIGDAARGNWSHVRQSWRDVVSSIAHLWQRVHHSMRKQKKAAESTDKASASTSPSEQSPTPAPVTSMTSAVQTVQSSPVSPAVTSDTIQPPAPPTLVPSSPPEQPIPPAVSTPNPNPNLPPL